jgi:hypothetical protein
LSFFACCSYPACCFANRPPLSPTNKSAMNKKARHNF